MAAQTPKGLRMSYEYLLVAAVAIVAAGILIAYDGSRDVFHPLVFIGPMLAFLYFWMPWQLYQSGGMDEFLDVDQLVHVQTLYVLGILAFVLGCLSVGVRVRSLKANRGQQVQTSGRMAKRLMIGGILAGLVGGMCWAITIHNVGGFVQAYGTSYSGGWDTNGYVRDGSLLLLTGIVLLLAAVSSGASKIRCWFFIAAFSLPWLSQALLMARRGPTFGYAIVVLMGWYFNRGKRPPILLMAATGMCLGYLVLFLVTNRGSIYLGSELDVNTSVGNIVDTADSGNEYIYGSGAVIAAEQIGHYFWLRRYIAEIIIRPIPSAIWDTKYEDFGVSEVLENAGTDPGISEVLGWKGAPGSAPGIISDLFIEVWWLAVPAMGLLGYGCGWVWRMASTRGGPWTSQYVISSSLAMYLVMQTMEAVIFRTLLLSIPCWITWRWAEKALYLPEYEAEGSSFISLGLSTPEVNHV
jgi:hypothetical protein